MTDWTHRICADCYIRKEIRENDTETIVVPVMLKQEYSPEVEKCCFCLRILTNKKDLAIYIRHDPKKLVCGGRHDTSDIRL